MAFTLGEIALVVWLFLVWFRPQDNGKINFARGEKASAMDGYGLLLFESSFSFLLQIHGRAEQNRAASLKMLRASTVK